MKKKRLFVSILLCSLIGTSGQASAMNVSGSTLRLILEHEQTTAQVNGTVMSLESPARIINGSFYIPIKWVGDQLGFKPQWNPERRTVGLTAPLAYVEWDLHNDQTYVNGVAVPLQETAFMDNGSLLVKLSWIAAYLNVDYHYQPNSSRIEITYVQKANTVYRESVYPEDSQPNSRPVAIFATDKAVYQIGEPVKYIDLSYDPDAEGLPVYEWTGKQEAFFEPGSYSVTLRVRDGNGNWSDPYIRTISVSNETFLSEYEYPWVMQPLGTMIKGTADVWRNRLFVAPQLPMNSSESADRKRIVSGNLLSIEQTGLLHQENLNGKGRVVFRHVNGLETSARFATVIHNPDEQHTLQVHVTRKAEISPTLFLTNVGYQTAIDFLAASADNQVIAVKPGETETLKSYLLEPGQGFASIYDIETEGEAEVGFIVTKADDNPKPLDTYTDVSNLQQGAISDKLYSNVYIDIDADKAEELSKWTIGDERLGSGAFSDFGISYSMTIHNPHKGAIALQAENGLVNGALKINGKLVPLPLGGITDQDGAFLVYRSDGTESSINIEWMSAPDSSSPVEWLYFPMPANQ